jgi:hypothetical protein
LVVLRRVRYKLSLRDLAELFLERGVVFTHEAVREWDAAGRPASGQRPGEGAIIGTMDLGGTTLEAPRYSAFPPLSGFRGDMEYLALYAGESCSLVHEIKPAGQIVRDLVREAEEVIEQMKRL